MKTESKFYDRKWLKPKHKHSSQYRQVDVKNCLCNKFIIMASRLNDVTQHNEHIICWWLCLCRCWTIVVVVVRSRDIHFGELTLATILQIHIHCDMVCIHDKWSLGDRWLGVVIEWMELGGLKGWVCLCMDNSWGWCTVASILILFLTLGLFDQV